MNGLPYYKAYPRDFIEGTIGMSFELKGAYRLVLDLVYMQGGMLPDDARYISGLLGCTIRKWKSLRDELVSLGKLQVNGEFLTNYRAVSELETLAKHQQKQRENARCPRENNGLQKPRLNHTEPDTDTDTEKKDIPPKSPNEFEQFWEACPRKIGKGQARRAWTVAAKKAAPHEIISAMQIQAKAWQQEGRATEYIPHPATWLNGERWADEVATKRTANEILDELIRAENGGIRDDTGRNTGPHAGVVPFAARGP